MATSQRRCAAPRFAWRRLCIGATIGVSRRERPLLAPDILDPCQVTVLRVDATPTIKRLIDGQLAQSATSNSTRSSRQSPTSDPAADSIWRIMQRPLALDSAVDGVADDGAGAGESGAADGHRRRSRRPRSCSPRIRASSSVPSRTRRRACASVAHAGGPDDRGFTCRSRSSCRSTI